MEYFVMFLLLSIGIPLGVYLYIRCKRVKYARINTHKVDNYRTQIINSGFIVDKEIAYPYKSVLILVDDRHKKIAIRTYEQDYPVFSYEDIISYDLIQDNQFLSTPTLESIVFSNNPHFAGSQNINGVCSMMQIQIHLNNLQSPQVCIPLVTTPIMKDDKFLALLKNVYEIIGTLEYIINNKVTAKKII